MFPHPKRSRGGQPGNKNAYKHGLYAQSSIPSGFIDPSRSDEISLVAEIELLRILIAKATQLAHQSQSIAEINACLRSISFAAANLNRLMRTQNLLNTITEKDESDQAYYRTMAEVLEELKAEGKKQDAQVPPARPNPNPGGTPAPASPPSSPLTVPPEPPEPRRVSPAIIDWAPIPLPDPPPFEDIDPYRSLRRNR